MDLFQKVTRAKSKARIALIGASGTGKTLSSLYLAYGLTGDWSKIALIDTEHERARFYANRTDLGTGEFLYAPLSAPYSAERYIEYVTAAAETVGSDGVIIIDSFSHAWNCEGGVLDRKEQIETQRGKTSFSAWNEAGKLQNHLINTILAVDCHTILTMRTKMQYAIEQNEMGKNVPVKIGLEPVQRENAEYEFDICLQINSNHVAKVSKDTTFLHDWSGRITPELGEQLKIFLSEGEDLPRCADCGKIITSGLGKTVAEIVEGTQKAYGRTLCMPCTIKIVKELKEQSNAHTSTVSS